MENKKVLLFTTDSVGGAERVTVIIGKYLIERGYRVTFCVTGGKTNKSSILNFIPKDESVVVVDYCHPLLMALKLECIVLRYSPDYVFSSSMYLNTKLLPFRFFFPNIHYLAFVILALNQCY